MSLLEGSLSGVEALRHLRLDLQARKKVICQFGSKLRVVCGLIKGTYVMIDSAVLGQLCA